MASVTPPSASTNPASPAPAATTAKPAAASAPPAPASTTDKAAAPATPAVVELVSMEHTAIFPKEKAHALIQAAFFIPPEGITDYWTPTPADLAGVETGLEKYLDAQGRKHHGDWALYCRQVAGVIVGGEQYLLFNYFTQDTAIEEKVHAAPNPDLKPDDWKTAPFWINDGGDVYFRVEFDPRKKQFIWYEKNSDA